MGAVRQGRMAPAPLPMTSWLHPSNRHCVAVSGPTTDTHTPPSATASAQSIRGSRSKPFFTADTAMAPDTLCSSTWGCPTPHCTLTPLWLLLRNGTCPTALPMHSPTALHNGTCPTAHAPWHCPREYPRAQAQGQSPGALHNGTHQTCHWCPAGELSFATNQPCPMCHSAHS